MEITNERQGIRGKGIGGGGGEFNSTLAKCVFCAVNNSGDNQNVKLFMVAQPPTALTLSSDALNIVLPVKQHDTPVLLPIINGVWECLDVTLQLDVWAYWRAQQLIRHFQVRCDCI